MDQIGMDVHREQSQFCTQDAEGSVREQRRIRTRPEVLSEVFAGRPRARILLEASTESEWVARCLESLGHEVIIADPNFAAMYATRSRRVKTDQRDAHTLADACRLGAYRPAHRVSDAQREVRAELAGREVLVRTRTRLIGLMRALLRGQGLRVSAGGAEAFERRLARVDLTAWLVPVLGPLRRTLAVVNQEVLQADRALARRAAADLRAQRLMSVPGVGPVTALAFVATLDEAGRFDEARQVASYLGLVPREDSSGERQHRGRITKAGNHRMRWLLVEAAWVVMRSKDPAAESLRAWCAQVALRRGRRLAIVGLARRLARVMYAMWRDATVFGQLHEDRRASA
jgi:transposase